MATTTFISASLIFANIWLIALVAFGVIASSVFLYILNNSEESIGPSLGISISCAALSFIYLTLQCVNVAHVKQGRWHQSWLSSICIQLPRVLIVLWMVATIVGFTSAVRKPLCRNPSQAGQDVTALQADLGCWVFRVLVFLDAIMLVLCFVLFCLMEVNGRYVSLALFHFEYTRSSASHPYRRRTLIASPYGASAETLTCPINTASGHGRGCIYEKHDFHSKRSLSPSPTYHTFDSAKTNTPLWPGNASSSGARTCCSSQDALLCDFPILLDLTLHGPLPARRSTAFTADIPFPRAEDMENKSIYSGVQLQSRPITHLPALPSPAHGVPLDLKDAPDPIMTAPMAAKALLDNDTTMCPAPQNHEVNMVEPRARFKSSSALPFEFATRAHSMVDLVSSCSMADLTTRTSIFDLTIQTKHKSTPSIDTVYRVSTSGIPEYPPPAWCPQSLKSAPLSADPAIRRLADFHPRSRTSAIRASRISNMGRRRGSLGAFEFGFVEGATPCKSPATVSPQIKDGGIDLLIPPPTPTPLARKRAMNRTIGQVVRGSTIGNDDKDQDSHTSTRNPGDITLTTLSTNIPTASIRPAKKERIMSRGRARNNTSINTTQVGQFSIMPPLTKTNRKRRNASSSTTNSGLGLTFDDGTTATTGNRKVAGSKMERETKGQGHSRSGSMAVTGSGASASANAGKKIVERGRWERLPR